MKRRLGWMVAAAVVLAAGVTLTRMARPKPARALGCAADTLQGAYGIHMHGWTSTSSGSGTLSSPFAQAGLATADGAGNIFLKLTTSVNGQVSQNISVPMKYQLDADCAGSMTPASGSEASPVDIVVSDGGKQVFLVGTRAGTTISGVAVRQ